METPAFLDQLVDWKDFEVFVRDMYASYPDLAVEHDVTMTGKSGAKRQIDVVFTHHVAGATYTTLVECKRWKEKVTRDRIDVLASGVEDLGASKGIMFTTTGYEAGAETFARSKSIDLFVVRDLLDEEWGLPGRTVSFWMHYYNGHFDQLHLQGNQLSIVTPAVPPKLDLTFMKEGQLDNKLMLRSFDGKRTGPNVVTALLEARRRVLARESAAITELFENGRNGAQRAIRVPMEIDFSGLPTRSLTVDYGRLDIDVIKADLLVTIKQSQFSHDRGKDLNLALAVEHLMTKQRQIVLRAQNGNVALHNVQDDAPDSVEDVVTPNTLMRIVLEAWVNQGEITGEIEQGNPMRVELSAKDFKT